LRAYGRFSTIFLAYAVSDAGQRLQLVLAGGVEIQRGLLVRLRLRLGRRRLGLGLHLSTGLGAAMAPTANSRPTINAQCES
jgi:hypothetical protein